MLQSQASHPKNQSASGSKGKMRLLCNLVTPDETNVATRSDYARWLTLNGTVCEEFLECSLATGEEEFPVEACGNFREQVLIPARYVFKASALLHDFGQKRKRIIVPRVSGRFD